MPATSHNLHATPAPTTDTLTLMVLHRRLDAMTVWRDLTGKLSQFCRLVRIELSEETMDTDTRAAPRRPRQETMIPALGGLIEMLAQHSGGIHMVSDSYGSPLARHLAQLHPQSLSSISFLDTPPSSKGASLGLRFVSTPHASVRADAAADECAPPFLAILRRHFVVEHRAS